MSNRKIDGRRIKIHRSYTIGEVAQRLDVHKRTIQAWIKAGLPCIKDGRPMLILGGELRSFLHKRRTSKKQKCKAGQLYCLKCRAPRRPAGGMLDHLPISVVSGNLKGICEVCDTFIFRRVSLAKIEAVTTGCDVAFPQAQQRIAGRN